MEKYWFTYNPGPDGETEPGNYVRLTVNPASGCSTGQILCAIYASRNPATDKPFSGDVAQFSTLFEYIGQARFNSGFPYPLRPDNKPFVYMKS